MIHQMAASISDSPSYQITLILVAFPVALMITINSLVALFGLVFLFTTAYLFDDVLMWWGHAQSHRAKSGDRWEERVSRRLQRIAEALNKDLNNGLEYGRLHRTLASVENELLSRRDAGK